MTHAPIPDFSHPVAVRRATVSPPAVPSAPVVERPRQASASPLVVVIVADWPDTPHSRTTRFLAVTGEALTAVAIIAGGVFAYGFLPFA